VHLAAHREYGAEAHRCSNKLLYRLLVLWFSWSEQECISVIWGFWVIIVSCTPKWLHASFDALRSHHPAEILPPATSTSSQQPRGYMCEMRGELKCHWGARGTQIWISGDDRQLGHLCWTAWRRVINNFIALFTIWVVLVAKLRLFHFGSEETVDVPPKLATCVLSLADLTLT